MAEQLLRTSDLCARLCMGTNAAKAVMAEYGVYPIPFGVGRGRGLRWLSSAVDAAILKMHNKAQPQGTTLRPRRGGGVDITQLTVDEIYDLTHAKNIQ